MVQTKTHPRKNVFANLLERRGTLLLDGGLATQLEAQGCDLNNPLWSAALLRSNPGQIVAAHKAYIDAGAECIATVSYQASREGFAQLGLSTSEADELILLSVSLAQTARHECGTEVAIAASLGPYGAMLHDGSEYHGDYGVSKSTLADFHRSRLQLLDDSGADVLALETVPSYQEAEVLAELLMGVKTPAWVSFSCKDNAHISDGTPIADAARLFAAHTTVVGVGINCTAPQYVAELVARVRKAIPDKIVLAYPNSGEIYDVDTNRWFGTVSPIDVATAALRWRDAGATVVGGCCRVAPEHIRAMASEIRRSTSL